MAGVLKRLPLLALAAFAGLALARPVHREAAIRQLRIEGSLLSKRTMACTYCHATDRGGAPWNGFGEALKAGFRADPKANFAEVMHALLASSADSDGDGYADGLEVFARTLPGDPESAPDEAVEDLTKRFEAAGGAGQYAPGKTDK